MPHQITGAVLAGGKSSRMGREKALLTVEGIRFVDRVGETLRSVCSDVFVVNGRPDQFEVGVWHVVSDTYPDCGPLGGIHAALTHSQNERVFVASCDAPFLTTEIVALICERADNAKAAVATVQGRVHPLCGIYTKKLLPQIYIMLRMGEYRVQDILRAVDTKYIELGETQALLNINTPAQYDALAPR